MTGDVTLKLEGKVVAIKIVNINADVSGGIYVAGTWTGDTGETPAIKISAGLKKIEAKCSIKTFWFTTPYGPATLLGETEPFFNINF